MPQTAAQPSERRIEATYRIRDGGEPVEAVARAIAFEQTVELPPALVTQPEILDRVVGRIARIETGPAGTHDVTIGYGADLAADQLPQLLNLLFGNVSLYPGVRLQAIDLPPALLERLPGPRFGVAGIRRLIGVTGRPLLASALKPRGTPVETLAANAHAFALGGGDLIKDDQNLVDDFETFKHRVDACREAVDAANQRTGRGCLYFPHVAGPADRLPRFFEYVARAGLRGVLACPMVMGIDTARALAESHGLALMAHPALTGSYLNEPHQGIAPALLLGTLFRLGGADISIFPNAGGRFAFEPGDCEAIAAALRGPLGTLEPAFPCPAGGMHLENVASMCRAFGPDTVLLIGGALLGHGTDLAESTRRFREAIEACLPGHEAPPAPAVAEPESGPAVLSFGPGFEWSERPGTAYKDAADFAFKGVRRVELVGKFGERTNSDLRYFEVEPGGFTSLEKHLHTHIVIGARGQGVLVLGNRRSTLAERDVAHIAPMQPHQLRNETDEPFGFFCIVDHVRDRPMQP